MHRGEGGSGELTLLWACLHVLHMILTWAKVRKGVLYITAMATRVVSCHIQLCAHLNLWSRAPRWHKLHKQPLLQTVRHKHHFSASWIALPPCMHTYWKPYTCVTLCSHSSPNLPICRISSDAVAHLEAWKTGNLTQKIDIWILQRYNESTCLSKCVSVSQSATGMVISLITVWLLIKIKSIAGIV